MARTGKAFDGPFGGLMARAMERMNRDAEAEAVELLSPGPGDRVLVLGFGPGLGVEYLARRLPRGRVVGVDPSKAMMKAAGRRNRRTIGEGRVELHQTTAESVPARDGFFDGAIAVNTLQLCEPIERTAQELARVLRPGAKLVSLTHDWAMKRHAASVGTWLAQTGAALAAAGFHDLNNFAARAEGGHSIALVGTRRG